MSATTNIVTRQFVSYLTSNTRGTGYHISFAGFSLYNGIILEMRVKNFNEMMGERLDLSSWDFAEEKVNIVYSGEKIEGLTKKVYKKVEDGVKYSVAVFKYDSKEFCLAYGTEGMCMSHALFDEDKKFTEVVFGCLDVFPIYKLKAQTGFVLNEKYLFQKNSEVKVLDKAELRRMKVDRYFPIIFFILLTVLLSLFTTILQDRISWMNFMSLYMGFFFLIFGTLKLFNLKNFAHMFSTYDLIASKYLMYGFVYPFIEILLGLGYFFLTHDNMFYVWLNVFTAILSLNLIVGINKKLNSGEGGKCACLGSFWNVPLSRLTVFENLVMFVMACVMLLL